MQKLLSAKKEQGQGLAEYALILIMVSVVVVVALSMVGPGVGNIFSEVVTVVSRVSQNPCGLETPCENDVLRLDLNVSRPTKRYSFRRWVGGSWVEFELTNSKEKHTFNYNCAEDSGATGCPL